jgi:3-hydroxyisobutyrate dehydrogenase
MQKPEVGFIGLGIMGKPMARNLVRAGYSLIVFNRTRSQAEAMASDVIRVADSPEQVAQQSEFIITMVTDSAAVEDVVKGPAGIIHGIKHGSVVVDMSTISPEVERNLDEELRRKSSTLLDAPVSGGDVGAIKGTLAIMAGGAREAFDKVLPLFQAMGETITYCGPVGSGQITKLCNQILVSVSLLGVCEAIVFARKNGLDAATMIEAVSGGAAGSWQLSNMGPKILSRDFDPGFMIDLMQKDLGLILEAADSASVSLPAAALVHHLFNAAQTHGYGRDGTQALARVLELLSNLGDA